MLIQKTLRRVLLGAVLGLGLSVVTTTPDPTAVTQPLITIPAITHLIRTAIITAPATTAARVITTVATGIEAVTDGVITAADITVGTINQRLNDSVFADEQGFIDHLFQLVAATHQMPKTLSDFSTVTD